MKSAHWSIGRQTISLSKTIFLRTGVFQVIGFEYLKTTQQGLSFRFSPAVSLVIHWPTNINSDCLTADKEFLAGQPQVNFRLSVSTDQRGHPWLKSKPKIWADIRRSRRPYVSTNSYSYLKPSSIFYKTQELWAVRPWNSCRS
mgnify:CR=1 FL=1